MGNKYLTKVIGFLSISKNRIIIILVFWAILIEYITKFAAGILYDIVYSYNCPEIKIDKIYLINLDRSPARLKSATAQLDRWKIPFSRFKAIDYKELIFTNLATNIKILGKDLEKNYTFFLLHNGKYLVSHPNFKETEFIFDNSKLLNIMLKTSSMFDETILDETQMFLPSEIGCAYSHISVINDIVKNNYKCALIFEDDVIIYPWFRQQLINIIENIPSDADVVFFGWENLNAEKGRILQSSNPNLYRYKGLFTNLHGYYVTNTGAKKILMASKTLRYAIDVHIANLSLTDDFVLYLVKDKALRAANEHELPSTIREIIK